MAKPVFDEEGYVKLGQDDLFVNSVLNKQSELVEEEFTHNIKGIFNFEAKELDEMFEQACKNNHNINTDQGAKKEFQIAYTQLLNKARAQIMGKLADRVSKLVHKVQDPELCLQPMPDTEFYNVTMDDPRVNQRYQNQYQDLFKGRVTGHQILDGKVLTTKVQQKQLFGKLKKEFDSSDDEDFDYYKFSEQQRQQMAAEKKKVKEDLFKNANEKNNLLLYMANYNHGVFPDEYYQYWLGKFAKAKDKDIRRPYHDRLLIELTNLDDKKLTFEYIEGDICYHGEGSYNGDVLVNLTDSNLTLNNEMSKKFNKGAGSIQENKRTVWSLYKAATDWIKKYSYIESGGIAYTDSHNLKFSSTRNCSYIFHTVTVGAYRHPHERSRFFLKRQIANILMTAKELECKSIVMPLLGVGDSNFPVDVAVELTANTIMEFHSVDAEERKNKGLWGKSTQLEQITILIWKGNSKDANSPNNPRLEHFNSAIQKFNQICLKYNI